MSVIVAVCAPLQPDIFLFYNATEMCCCFFFVFFYILLIYFCKQQIILYILGRICPTSHFSGDIFVDSILVGY